MFALVVDRLAHAQLSAISCHSERLEPFADDVAVVLNDLRGRLAVLFELSRRWRRAWGFALEHDSVASLSASTVSSLTGMPLLRTPRSKGRASAATTLIRALRFARAQRLINGRRRQASPVG